MNYITASCSITDQAVRKNGETLFKNINTGLPGFLLSVYRHFEMNYPRFYKMDNLSKLGWLATEILLKEGFRKEDYRPEEIGVILTNANSSLDTDQKYFESAKDIPSPSLFVYTLPNIVIGEICIRNNFKGEGAFFISGEFDADFMERTVGNLMDNNILNACICGWVDLLGEEYKALLFLVEKGEAGSLRKAAPGELFTKENIDKTFPAEKE
jgi:hypothetical protein